MKKIFISISILIVVSLSAFAQSIVNPLVDQNDDPNTKITSIETNSLFTIVHFETAAEGDSAWTQVNKEIYIQTDVDKKHYGFVKAEGIPMFPAKHYLKTTKGKLPFTVFFEKIPASAKSIDIIERAGNSYNGETFFNFYGVSLTLKDDAVSLQSSQVVFNGNSNAGNMSGIMADMTPMFNTLAKTMMNAQIDFYKQPGKLEEVAKLNKQYYDALISSGFTADQAIKIITSEGLLPKANLGSK
jgi:hypothetical protein